MPTCGNSSRKIRKLEKIWLLTYQIPNCLVGVSWINDENVKERQHSGFGAVETSCPLLVFNGLLISAWDDHSNLFS